MRLALAAVYLLLAPLAARGQGTNNPTGVTGIFNGNSTTGCSYDPYTANAQRIIPDLTVAGAVGKYPLQWARIMNSRAGGLGKFGAGGGWSHSYQWRCTADESVVGASPPAYTVYYPDGRVVKFAANPGTPLLPPVGVTDQFLGGTGNNVYVYLYMKDGGKVRFLQTYTKSTDDSGQTTYTFTISLPDQIIDPFSQITALSYDTSTPPRLNKVVEPGGRYLIINYGTNGYISEVDAYTAANHETQWVKYTYASQSFGGVPYTLLTRADYIYASGAEPAPVAYYAYQASNLSASGTPLIKTCQDVRFPGPMKNIQYVFVTNSPLSYGQLSKEEDFNGVMVDQLTISGSTRTETRGDATNSVRNGTPVRTFTYGGSGAPETYLLTKSTDFRGNATTFAYNSDGFVSSVTDAKSHVTSYTYLNQGFPTGVVTKITHPGDGSTFQSFYTDATGSYLDHTIDELNHTTTYKRTTGTNTTYEIDYPDGGIEKYTYNGFGEVLTHTMPSPTATNGAASDSEKYSYGSTGLLLSYTPPSTASDPSPSPHPTKYQYDTNDHVSTITDPRNHVTTQYHNEVGQLTEEVHPDADNSETLYAYNADETLQYRSVQLTTSTWAETDYTYDDYKRVVSMTDPVGNVTNYWYNTIGGAASDLTHTDSNITRVQLPSLNITMILYDENLRKCWTKAAVGTSDGAITTYSYDAVGNLLTMVDPNGQSSGATWTYNYDQRNRLINVTDPLAADRNTNGHTADYTYDYANNKASETRANNQVITYNTYDPMNRLTEMTVGQSPDPAAVTTYTWSNSGKMLSMVDPLVHTYSYAYDNLNRLTGATYPMFNGGNPQEGYSYDIAGNLSQFTNRNGNVQTFTYDSRNRETNNSWDDGVTPTRALTYDDNSRVLSCITNAGNGATITFTYFDDGKLKSQVESCGYFGDNMPRTINYTYNPDGLRSSATLAGSTVLDYTYTARDQVLAVTNSGNTLTFATYGYDPNGNMTSRTPLNGVNSTFAYDAVNRITDITHPLADGSKTFHYNYNAVGDRLSTLRNGSATDTFGYDSNSQLTSFTPSGQSATSFGLDASGNRTSVGGVSYGVNNLNEYTTVGGKLATYDNGGNVLSRYDASGNYCTYTYDALNRLIVANDGSNTRNFYYDGLNRQIARSGSALPSTYSVWDGWTLFAEYGWRATSTSRVLYHGAGGDLLSQLAGNPGVWSHYFPDGIGSTAYVASGNGYLAEQYTYDAFGTPSFFTSGGIPLNGGSAFGIDFLFTGSQWNGPINLYDNRHRFYAPDWGRFLQADPIGFAGDAANMYRYCGNNPANARDSLGEKSFHGGVEDLVGKVSGVWVGNAGTGPSYSGYDGNAGSGIYAFDQGNLGIVFGGALAGVVYNNYQNLGGVSYNGQKILGIQFSTSTAQDDGSVTMGYVGATADGTTYATHGDQGNIPTFLSRVLQSIGLSITGFSSADSAATAAIDSNLTVHMYNGGDDTEVAGVGYQNSDCSWAYTVAYDPRNNFKQSYAGSAPPGDTAAFIWHIHTGDPRTITYDFSPADKSFGLPNYLGTPDRMIQVWNPGSGPSIVRPPSG